MLYYPGMPEDDIGHKLYHKEKLNPTALAWVALREQKLVRSYSEDNSFIVHIDLDDKISKNKRILQIVALVDEQLGFSSNGPPKTQVVRRSSVVRLHLC